ncbi:MAG: Signal peptidase I T [Chloroflexi bacterium ADurb.Bin325]|nr:MAG: Signal peptidase I T [Chloroflexi bacterium ADurb.Bin325]
MTDLAETTPKTPRQPQRRGSSPAGGSIGAAVWELVQVVGLALLMVILIRNFVQNYRIDGISMEPNFHDGQFLIVNRYAYCPGINIEIPVINKPLFQKTWCVRQPKRGEVIVFVSPQDSEKDFIKRVIGLPGDVVEVRSGEVFINGQRLPEPFGPYPGNYSAGAVTVGEGEVYVMGDNRNNSSDSHVWGTLSEKRIIGKALVSYWPPRYWSVVPHYDLNTAAGQAAAGDTTG